MKTIFAILVAILIITKTAPSPDRCDRITAAGAVPVRIFAETTIDGRDQVILVTRFFHNKLGIYTSEFARCYFGNLDLNFIKNSTSIFGLFAIMFFVFRAITRKYYALLAVFLASAILPFLTASTTILIAIYKIFAIIGLLLWLRE